MLLSIQPDFRVLSQDNVFRGFAFRIFLTELLRIAPFGAAVFFALAVVALRGEIYAKPNAVQHEEYQDSPK